MFDLSAYLAAKRSAVDQQLNAILQGVNDGGRIYQAMRYSLKAGGKRVRPVLAIAAAEAVGGKDTDVLSVACTLEIVHTYSLIHDDLPAMDNDDLRRGQPSSHIQFDEATAILAGDALLTLAFETLSSAAVLDNLSPTVAMEVIHELARAAGCQGMIKGQMLDILAEGNQLSLTELESIHSLKTGALIQASVVIGGLIAKATEQEIEMLREYGRHIGFAFQVMDDILNVKGDPALMGKAVGSDAARNKKTYPMIMGLAASENYASQLVKSGLQAVHGFDNKADPLRAIGKYIVERKR